MSDKTHQTLLKNKKEKNNILDLSHHNLISLPKEISEFYWLKEIRLNDNPRLCDLSEIMNLNNLQAISISRTGVLDLSFLHKLTNLIAVYASSIIANDLGPLRELIKLKILYITYTLIENLSPLSDLKNIEIINASNTKINNLPKQAKWGNLQRLYLNYTQIRDLTELSQFTNLEILDISNTQTNNLSPIQHLKKIKIIYFHDTKINNLLPLGTLSNLESLDLSNTNITDLSPILPIIEKTDDLKWNILSGPIRAKNCPLTSPPLEIAMQGKQSIIRYFEQLEKEGIDQIYEAKLILIGEGGAGKTSLCRKLFDPISELPKEKESTQGIDIQPLYFNISNGKQFRLNVWDFAGQGKYQSAHSFFYTHRSLYVLVDDTRTLDENEAYRTFYHYWLQTVELFGDDSPLLVLHNQKADRARTGFNLGSFQAIFPFVKELFCINLGSDNMASILDLKQQIERWAQKLPHIGDVVPKTWVKVREDIETERQERPYISDERYREICSLHGITDEAKQSDLSRYFHDLGVFLHFQENPLLRRDVFLQNEWVTDAVYKILDDPEIAVKKRGRFDKGDLARLWNEGFYAKRRDELLALMLQFELCYQVQDTEIYVAPQLLPGDLPKYHLGADIPLQLKYEYGFMPKGLLYRLIVRLHRHIAQGQSAVWNGGVVLERAGAQADILESLDRRQISVRATGTRAKELVTIISEEVEKLHDTYGERLKVETKIPCNCRICKNSQTPHFYDKKDLDNRLTKGKRTVECRVSFDDVNVQGLLDGVFTQVLDIDAVTASHRINTTHIRELIEEGETKKALEIFKKVNPNEATVLLGKLAELNKKHPTLSGEEYLREKSKIDTALLALL